MPELASRQPPIKMMLIGESGSGKTGALASLAEAGYNLRIADFDDGLDPLIHLLRSNPEAMARVNAVTLKDRTVFDGSKVVVKGVPKAFSSFFALLDNWENLGSITSWGPDDILVLDSYTFFCRAGMRWFLRLNKRDGERPWLSDWGEVQRLAEQFLDMIHAGGIRCNIIVLTHIHYEREGVFKYDKEGKKQEVGQVDKRGLPMAIGQALSPKIPSYFNTVLMSKSETQGSRTERLIYTTSQGVIELKCPVKMPARLPQATGLAQLFQTWRKSHG